MALPAPGAGAVGGGGAAPAAEATMGDKIVKWVMFGVLFAVLPLLLDVLNGSFHATVKKPFDWHDPIKKGELFLISAGIAGTSIGEILDAGNGTPRWYRSVSGGGCILIAFGAAVLYAMVRSEPVLDADGVARVATWSLSSFIAAVGGSIGCVLAGRGQK